MVKKRHVGFGQRRPACKGSIVNQGMDGAERCKGTGGQLLHLRRVRKIPLQKGGSVLAQVLTERPAPGGISPVDDYASPLTHKPLRHGRANSCGAARDQDYLVLQSHR